MSLPGADRTVPPVQLPIGVRTARLVLWVQGVVGVFIGISIIPGYQAVTSAYNLSGNAAYVVVVIAGTAIAVASALVLWGATLLGSLSHRARTWVLVYEWVSVVLGLVTIADDLWESSLRIILAAVVIYYLQVDRESRVVFGLPPTIRNPRGSPSNP